LPNLVDTAPKSELSVKYGELTVKLGNVLTPTQVKNPPAVQWSGDSSKFYVLCMTGKYFVFITQSKCLVCD